MKHSFFRFFAISLFFVLLLVVACLAFLPTYLSTQNGKEKLTTYLNSHLSGRVAIEKLNLSWFGNQQIEGFQLLDEKGEKIFTFECFSTKASLFSLIFDPYRFKKTILLTPSLYLQEESDGRFNIEKALCLKERETKTAKGKRKREIPHLKGELSIEKGIFVIKTPKVEVITISDIDVQMREKGCLFYLSGKTRQGTIEGSVSLTSKKENAKLALSADFTRIPTMLFDQLFESQLLSAAIGPTLDCKFSVEEKADRFFLVANINAANLQGELLGVASNSTFTFDPKSKILFTLTPAFFSSAFESPSWRLANKTDVQLAIKELKLPLDFFTDFPFTDLESFCFPFSSELLLSRAELVHETFGNLSLIDAKVNFFGTRSLEVAYSGEMQSKEGRATIAGSVKCERSGKLSFYGNCKDIPTPLLELFISDSPYLSPLFGTRFDLTTSGTIDQKGVATTYAVTTQNLNIEGTAQGESLEAVDLAGKGKFFLPSQITPFLGASLDFNLKCELSYFNHNISLPLVSLKVKNQVVEAEVKGLLGKKGKPFNIREADLVIKGSFPRQEKIKIFDKGSFFAHVNGNKNEINADLDLQASFEKDRGAVAHLKIAQFISEENKLDFSSALYTFDGCGYSLPVSQLQALFDIKAPLSILIGEKMNVEMLGNYIPKEKSSLTFNALGEGFQVKLALCMDPSLSFIETKPFEVNWEITDERYQALYCYLSQGLSSRYKLLEPAKAAFTVDKFACPSTLVANPLLFLSQTSLLGDFSVTPLAFEERTTHKKLVIEKTEGKLESEDFQKAIQISFNQKLNSDELPPDTASEIAFQGTILDLLTADGKMNLSGMKATVDLKVDLLPVRAVTALFPIPELTKKTMDALLGDMMNARLQGEFINETGPFTLDIKSTNLKAILPLYFNHWTVTLTKNVEAELTLTQEVNELFLKDLNPLLITGAYSSHPIRFFIESEGFSLPLHPFHIENVQIEKGVLDLGVIEVKNGGQFQSLMEFLKATEVTPAGLMEAWFTPIFFSLKEGNLSYKRFDVRLAGKVHIAFWGHIDLKKDKVRMTMGISPKDLRARFNLIGLSKKDMFQVKMRGSTSELELDWSSAYTRLGILLTRTAGGHIGYLVGGILEQIVQALGEEPTPPPTTSPLPWESGETETEDEGKVGMPEEAAPPAKGKNAGKNEGLKRLMEFIVP